MAKQLSRRGFLRISAGMGGAAVLAACGQQPAAPGGETAATAVPAGGETAATTAPVQGDTAKQKITVWFWDAALAASVEGFKTYKPNIEVEFVQQPFADSHDKLLTSLAAGTGAPDVASLEIGRVGNFVSKGGLSDLKGAPFDAGSMEKDIVAYKWTQGSTPDGRLIAMPWDIGPAGVWYRTDLFEANGYPIEPEAVAEKFSGANKTWDDYLAFAKEFKDKSGGKTSLFADAGTDLYGAIYRQQGAGYFEGNKALIEEKATSAFSFASRGRKEALDANIPWWGPEWQAGLKDNAIAGMVIACWMQGGLTREQPDLIGKWRVVPAPVANYNWGGSFMSIPEQSANKEAAWEFIKYVCATAEGQNTLFKTSGIFPAYKPAWQDPLYDQGVDFFGGQKVYRLWADISDNVKANFTSPFDLQAEDLVGAELTKVLQEDKDPVQAAKDAEAEALLQIEGATN